MKRLIVSLSAVLLSAGAIPAEAKDSNGCAGLDKKVVALVSQYKELRERRHHLPDGVFDKDVRDHGGKLHEVLVSLGTELGHPPYRKKTIVGCLGEPDAIRNENQMARFLGI